MTRQDLIQAIEQACQKTNPDLLKLEFGCRIKVKYRGTQQDYIWDVTVLSVSSGGGAVYAIGKGHREVRHFTKDIIEILGKEPQLSSVLLAIKCANGTINIDEEGEFFDYSMYEANRSTDIFWDLTKGLYGQSLETLQFIHSLLS